jgi:hypothetical protein
MPVSSPSNRGQEIFDPETIAVLAMALQDALRQLQLVYRNDPAVTEIAKTIIELARRGERNPIRLRDLAVEAFRGGGRDSR